MAQMFVDILLRYINDFNIIFGKNITNDALYHSNSKTFWIIKGNIIYMVQH